jgi:hypothetical protein
MEEDDMVDHGWTRQEGMEGVGNSTYLLPNIMYGSAAALFYWLDITLSPPYSEIISLICLDKCWTPILHHGGTFI